MTEGKNYLTVLTLKDSVRQDWGRRQGRAGRRSTVQSEVTVRTILGKINDGDPVNKRFRGQGSSEGARRDHDGEQRKTKGNHSSEMRTEK